MSDRSIGQLTQAYLDAYQNPTARVSSAAVAALTAAEAMAVQGAVLQRLGETVAVAKVAAPAGGIPLAAPIINSWVTQSGGTLALGGRNLMGLEIEVAAVLKTDITPDIAGRGKAAVQDAIDHYVVGIELIGTRLEQHTQAGPYGPLSDFMLTAGYVIGTQKIASLPDIDGLPIVLETLAGIAQLGPAKHPFGDVLAPILAYAAPPFDQFGGLRAGMTVTTGSLCALIEVPATGWLQLRLGNFEPVSVTLS